MLSSIAPYIQTCKESNALLLSLKDREYLLEDPKTYSLKDLIAVKQEEFKPFLVKILQQYTSHLKTCDVRPLFAVLLLLIIS